LISRSYAIGFPPHAFLSRLAPVSGIYITRRARLAAKCAGGGDARPSPRTSDTTADLTASTPSPDNAGRIQVDSRLALMSPVKNEDVITRSARRLASSLAD
jgi:hypothetical protein